MDLYKQAAEPHKFSKIWLDYQWRPIKKTQNKIHKLRKEQFKFIASIGMSGE